MIRKFFQNLFRYKDTTMSTSTVNLIPIKCSEIETAVKVNQLTDNPEMAWEVVREQIPQTTVEPLKLDEPIKNDKVRFVFISDTHSRMDKMHHEIPDGDVLIHAGDFTNVGNIKDVTKFSNELKTLKNKFKHIVVIVGNHELSFDKTLTRTPSFCFTDDKEQMKQPRNYLHNCIYLEDSYIELYGLKIYGSPWTPRFCDWAFNVDRGADILKKWNQIPSDTDILITHGPPLGFGDIVRGGYHVGCCELLSTVRERVKPKIHVFGHIHEDHGIWTDECTTYINASICNVQTIPKNPPIIFDIDLPNGITKSSFDNLVIPNDNS